jgi:hypothetical protein
VELFIKSTGSRAACALFNTSSRAINSGALYTTSSRAIQAAIAPLFLASSLARHPSVHAPAPLHAAPPPPRTGAATLPLPPQAWSQRRSHATPFLPTCCHG